jgi:hypothetical protein
LKLGLEGRYNMAGQRLLYVKKNAKVIIKIGEDFEQKLILLQVGKLTLKHGEYKEQLKFVDASNALYINQTCNVGFEFEDYK